LVANSDLNAPPNQLNSKILIVGVDMRKTHIKLLLSLPTWLMFLPAATLAADANMSKPVVAAAAAYALKAAHPVSGEGGSDYLSYDASNNGLFITRGNPV
jgi:hypothetical protein